MAAGDSNLLKSSEKLFHILELLLEKGDAGVTELANDSPFHKSTVYVHLQTMQEYGFVVKSGTKYRLSLKFLSIGEILKNKVPVYQHGHQEIDSLADGTGELAFLAVPEGDDAVVVHSGKGEKATRTVSVGSKFPIEGHSVGKVLLAFQSEIDQVDANSAGGESPHDKVVDRPDDELSEELEKTRSDGFNISKDNDESSLPYIAEPDSEGPRSESHRTEIQYRTVAAPILYQENPVAAVAITGPSKRISGEYEETIRDEVVRTAAAIERKLDLSQSTPYSDQ